MPRDGAIIFGDLIGKLDMLRIECPRTTATRRVVCSNLLRTDEVIEMRRREFIALLGTAAAWPLAAHAQQLERMRRLGVLTQFGETDKEASQYIGTFRKGLEAFGWREGQNLHVDYRWGAGDSARMRTYAGEIVELLPDVILVASPTGLSEIAQATRTIPIVFVQVADPVGGGFVKSLANPGGNVTGFTSFEETMSAKWLELLREIVPQLTRVAVLRNPATSSASTYILGGLETAARVSGIELAMVDVRSVDEINPAFNAFEHDPPDGLVVMPDALFSADREMIVALAALRRLPAVYYYRYYASSGGLLSYGPSAVDLYRRAASYVDRILRGAKPENLPVQQPTKFELVINLKTAEALGLAVSPALLARADEVIE
jgi:putative ABC transport system substrate-binding protein